MGILNWGKKAPEPIEPQHDCEKYALLDQEGDYVRYWCGKCDKTIRKVYDPPPPHGYDSPQSWW